MYELINALSAATDAARVSRQTSRYRAAAIRHGLPHVTQTETQAETAVSEYRLTRDAAARLRVELHHAARAAAIAYGIGTARRLMPRPDREKPRSATLCIFAGEQWALTCDDRRDVIGETFGARLRATERENQG